MQITDLKVHLVDNPAPKLGGEYFIIIELQTDNGILGIGEAYYANMSAEVCKAMIIDVFKRCYLNHSPYAHEKNARLAISAGYSLKYDLAISAAVSALEIACWDIIGKATNLPIYQLLGGKVFDKLRAYSYLYPRNSSGQIIYDDIELTCQCAKDYQAEQISAVKYDPMGGYSAFDPRQPSLSALNHAQQLTAKLHATLSTGTPKVDLLFGTHGQFTASGALRLARLLEPFDPLWFEEPTPPLMPEQMALVAKGCKIPIATGERLAGKHEFMQLALTQAASIWQINLGRCGGLLEAKKIAAIAEANHCQIAPHNYCGPVVWSANAQLASTCPNFLILESIYDKDCHYDKIVKQPYPIKDGYVHLFDKPGLGIELNYDFIKDNPYDGNKLHLQVSETPLDH